MSKRIEKNKNKKLIFQMPTLLPTVCMQPALIKKCILKMLESPTKWESPSTTGPIWSNSSLSS